MRAGEGESNAGRREGSGAGVPSIRRCNASQISLFKSFILPKFNTHVHCACSIICYKKLKKVVSAAHLYYLHTTNIQIRLTDIFQLDTHGN